MLSQVAIDMFDILLHHWWCELNSKVLLYLLIFMVVGRHR